jgi:hypothetical protein
VLPDVAGLEKDSREGKRISKRRGEIFKEKYFPGLRAFPKTRDLLERMHGDGLRIIAARRRKRTR